jgi:Domain of unknown function (DUF4286)
MSEIAYTVAAILPSHDVAARYLDWLTSDHIAKVCAKGAVSAVVVQVTDPAAPIRIESRYTFPNQSALDTYLSKHAPALRAEGLAAFPPAIGIRFERSVGVIHLLKRQ